MTTSASALEFDVAVIGYGPTGATLANLLACCGVNVIVIEKESRIYHLPRAVHLDDETMRVFQTVGITDHFKEQVRVNPGMRFVDPHGKLLMDWPRPQEVSLHGWRASYRFHQPDLEKLLRAKLQSYENAEIRTLCTVTSLKEEADGVTVGFRDQVAECNAEIRVGYVVGCDGANSFVRNAIGVGMDDFGFFQRWLVIDLLLKRNMPELGNHSIQFCEPERPMTYCRGPGERRRWEINLHDYENSEDVIKPERVWDFLSRWLTPDDAELERSTTYTFRSAVAKEWRKGHLLIAGDAAHLTPPFMGQGMCAGIRDASNLAWKLALCIQGKAPESLLDSYQEERGPVARDYVQGAIRLGDIINSMDRNRALEIASEKQQGTAVFRSIQPLLGETSESLFNAMLSPNRGKVFGQPRLSDDRLLDDVIGYAPALLSRTPIGASNSDLPIFDASEHPSIGEHLDTFDVHAVLLRPDRYVLADAQTAEDAHKLSQILIPSPINVYAK